MKRRRGLIAVLIVCVAAVLGIGYAALSDKLTINGTLNATPSDSNFVVEFDTAAQSTTASHCTVSDVTATTATMTVTGEDLTTKGNTATATLTIKNSSSELGASLTASVTNDNEEFFTVTYEFAQNSIAASGTTTITVTVELAKTPIENVTGSFTVTITATSTVAA